MFSPRLFDSYFLGGFECSTHRRHDGRRLDLLAATRHDRRVVQDYRRMVQQGIRTVRDGVRWHLIEGSRARYDWSSFLPMLHASRDISMQVFWDLCHYGWPDDIDIWADVRLDLFEHLSGHPVRYFADHFAGSLGNRITSTAGAIGALISTFAWNMVPPCVDFSGAVIVLTRVDRAVNGSASASPVHS